MTKQKVEQMAQENTDEVNAEDINVEAAIPKTVEEPKMEKLTIQDLPGVGAATAEKLEAAGYRD